jgi:hypothetical protein
MSRSSVTAHYDLALADDLAKILADAPFGLPLDELARRRGRRDGAIRAVLRADPRFLATGSTRGRRWRLALEHA